MTEAMYDLMYIIATLVRIIMMISITSITIYFIKFFKSRLRRKSNLTIKQLNKVEEKPCVIGLYFVNLYIIKKEKIMNREGEKLGNIIARVGLFFVIAIIIIINNGVI